MRIGISTRGLYQGSYAVSTIVLHLTRAIIELGSNDHEIFLYFNNPDFESLFPQFVQKRSVLLNNRFLWDHSWLPFAIRSDQVDITLFMKGTMPFYLPSNGAVIFHDLGYFHNEIRPYRWYETIYMKRVMTSSAHRASVIFADSEYTRNEAIEIFRINPSKITVCYQNCSPRYKRISDPQELEPVKSLYNLPPEYIFCPISLSPRKNLERIIAAFNEIKDGIPHYLVITGGQAWGVRGLEKWLDSETNHRIRLLGAVPPDHLPALYNMASFTLYPSLLEGFGLPILEAFRCGSPVLTSNITSMPEVAGEAAYMVDPYDTKEIAEGMVKLATDKSLIRELQLKGFERANIFSWERTAKIILEQLVTDLS